MVADDLNREQKQFEERLDRDGGLLIEPHDSETAPEELPPDDYVTDPWADGDRPGTVDDLPYTMGVETPDADDLNLVPEGATRRAGSPAPDEEREAEPGRRDERDLWAKQKPLIAEDEDDGIKLPGFDDETAKRVVDAMGDDVADPLPDAPNGTSATGSVSGPDHGGFPERD